MSIHQRIEKMKESYFTSENIHDQSVAMLSNIRDIVPLKMARLSTVQPPGGIALLILDMQQYFLEPQSHAFVPSAPAIIPNILKLQHFFTQHRWPIIYTRHLNTPSDGGLMDSWWRELIQPGNPLSSIIQPLAAPKKDILHKTRYDAFLYTDLEERLKRAGVSRVVICGVMTHLCCESTARSAFMRGFQVLFSVDGCAAYNRRFHNAALLNLAHGFAFPLLVEEILELINA